MRFLTIILAAALLAGCAKSAASIRPLYVNPVTYGPYNCAQLEEERDRLAKEVATVTDTQNKSRTGDAVLTTVGAIIFWPALIGLAFTEDQAAELGRLKGEYDAVEAAQRQHGCLLAMEVAAPQ